VCVCVCVCVCVHSLAVGVSEVTWAPLTPAWCCAQVETRLCRVVVMDQTGSDKARNLARALRREGLNAAYVMKVGRLMGARAHTLYERLQGEDSPKGQSEQACAAMRAQ